MSGLIALPVVLPLTGAAAALLLQRWRRAQRAAVLVVLGATVVVSAVLLVDVDRHGVIAADMGGWPAPYGITFVVDLFSALMLAVSMVTVLVVYVYAMGEGDVDERSPFFGAVYLTMTAGVAASFLTGDLFNLFVAVEVTLASSYVLITLGGRREQVRSGMTYVTLNLLGSTMFLATVGLVYASTGTVNMADLFTRLDTIPVGLRTALGLMLLVAFGVKAAVFPLFSWLPDSYPAAPAPVTAVFAGLLTKVGVYAIIRTQAFYFGGDGSPSTLLLVVAGFTMVVGVLGAIAQNDIKRILSFHIVSQIGYMIMGLALFTVAGIAGAIFFIVHQIPVKTSLFLVSGIVERRAGTASLRRLGGLVKIVPASAVLFMLAALSLAGVPPFSGFVGKLALVEAGFGIREWAIVGVSLVVSLLTLFSMIKVWNGAFWGRSEETRVVDHRPLPVMVGATALLVAVSLAIALAARPIYSMSERAASTLLEPTEYVDAVIGEGRR